MLRERADPWETSTSEAGPAGPGVPTQLGPGQTRSRAAGHFSPLLEVPQLSFHLWPWARGLLSPGVETDGTGADHWLVWSRCGFAWMDGRPASLC